MYRHAPPRCSAPTKLEPPASILKGRTGEYSGSFPPSAGNRAVRACSDAMRLDKYLKVSRLIKRRTIANEACDKERVSVNGRQVKASYQVKVGDVIEISFGTRSLKVEVTEISETANKASAPAMYKEIE